MYIFIALQKLRKYNIRKRERFVAFLKFLNYRPEKDEAMVSQHPTRSCDVPSIYYCTRRCGTCRECYCELHRVYRTWYGRTHRASNFHYSCLCFLSEQVFPRLLSNLLRIYRRRLLIFESRKLESRREEVLFFVAIFKDTLAFDECSVNCVNFREHITTLHFSIINYTIFQLRLTRHRYS